MLEEIRKLTLLIDKDEMLRKTFRWRTLTEIVHTEKSYPVTGFSLGSEDPTHPVLFLTGGVHGLERIGAQLAWSFLKTTIERFLWDKTLRTILANVRLVVVPLVNPVGYTHFTRCNGRGVDLMRNSPVRATEAVPFLLGGHSYSHRLPWFRGSENVLEPENFALLTYFQEQAQHSRCVVAIDFHSGFGMRDRLWFPFSYTKEPFYDLPEMHALTHLLEQMHPYHVYKIEPQSKGYLLSGDIWDHCFLELKKVNPSGTFLPITLEMGSWTWVRKNPLQLFSLQGAFNPVKLHRVKRTYRRHHLLFDFLLRAVHSHEVWANLPPGLRIKHSQLALERWYEQI